MHKVAAEVIEVAKRAGWTIKERRVARTKSVYALVARDGSSGTEWVVIRVANHKQVYSGWLQVVSVAPGDRWFEELEEILTRPYGSVGDIL